MKPTLEIQQYPPVRLLRAASLVACVILATGCAGLTQKHGSTESLEQDTGIVTLGSEEISPQSVHDFSMTTDRGTAPSYTVGDATIVRIEPVVDSYLTCFYELASGQLLKLYPNRFQPNSLIQGGTSLLIPGDERFTIQFDTSDSVERFLCFTADKDVTPFIAPTLRDNDLTPINTKTLSELYKSDVATLEDLYSIYYQSTGINLIGKILVVTVQ